MPGYKIGRLWKFKRTEIDEWVHTDSDAKRSAGEDLDEIKEKA